MKRFKNIIAVFALMVMMVGCESAASEPNPIREPQKLDCDLIFPAPISPPQHSVN